MEEEIRRRKKEIEVELERFYQRLYETDAKLRAYLADRANKPHPRHEDLIQAIRNYRIPPRYSTKHLETMLENLQWKAYYFEQSWRQIWENAERLRLKQFQESKRQAPPTAASDREKENNATKQKIYSVDRLWELQQRQRKQMGLDPEAESRTDFIKRIKKEYGRLASEKKSNEEIIMTFDSAQKRCRLTVRRKETE